jgi:hypothetical protein
MTKLRELKLYSCQISRIQNLEPCGSLMALHLEDNHIGAIEGLDKLRGLEYLNLDSNRVQKIGNGLARLTKLKELHLSRNQLISLEGLAGLASLETCSFDHNRLCQVRSDHVKGLGKLDELHIAGNHLESLSFLAAGAHKAQLPNLMWLDASGNRLNAASLRNLPELAQVAELSLAGNEIEVIEPCVVKSFPSLEILDLSGNRLTRGAEDMEQLKNIASLRELLIQGNPFTSQSEPEQVQQAMSILSCLEFLDDQPLERKPEAQVLSLEGGEDDTKTFELTVAKGVSDGLQPEQGSRPGTAVGSRPTTADSRPSTARPGTAQKMLEAGVQNPLMHLKPKLSDKRYASEEQVTQWERQTINSLLAVQKQIDKTCIHMDADLRDMSTFLSKADKVLEREKELNAKREAASTERDGMNVGATRRSMDAERRGDDEARADSRVKYRLLEAVERGRETPTDDMDEMLPQERSRDEDLPNEEIPEEEHPVALLTSARRSPSPPAEEVEEELLHGGGDVPVTSSPAEIASNLSAGLGARAARAVANASANVSAGRDLHVEARAKDRGALVQRPSSRGSQGRPGSQGKKGGQPSPAQRNRPPAAPVRTTSRGAKR